MIRLLRAFSAYAKHAALDCLEADFKPDILKEYVGIFCEELMELDHVLKKVAQLQKRKKALVLQKSILFLYDTTRTLECELGRDEREIYAASQEVLQEKLAEYQALSDAKEYDALMAQLNELDLTWKDNAAARSRTREFFESSIDPRSQLQCFVRPDGYQGLGNKLEATLSGKVTDAVANN